jgi:predicted nucleic acid-binding protein
MKIVIDSNVLFSALIKDAITRKIILEYDYLFLFPYYIFDEFENHRLYLIEKSNIEVEEFNELLELILSRVTIVSSEVLQKHKTKAIELAKNIDKNDAIFFACALAYPGSAIWSDDKALKKQDKIKILNTSEMLILK